MERPRLHNVTVYVDRADLERTRDFYVALFQGHVVWEEPGHIACVGTEEIAVCVHEAAPGHPAGTREFFFHSQELEQLAAVLGATGVQVQRSVTTNGGDELRCVDPIGNQIRVHLPKP